jgi:hypothetical protein
MQFALGVAGAICFVCIFIFFPETSQPGKRGIDKYRAEHPGKKFTFVWLNPLRPLLLLRSPVILMLSLAGTGVLITDYGKFPSYFTPAAF